MSALAGQMCLELQDATVPTSLGTAVPNCGSQALLWTS